MDRAIRRAFQLRPRCVCSTALGVPVEPEVKRTTRHVGRPDRLGPPAPPVAANATAARRIRERASRPTSTNSGRVDLGQRGDRPRPAEGVQERCGDRPDAPAGAGRTAAARLFGSCQATASPRRDPRARRPPATGATRSRRPGAEPRVPVDHVAAVAERERRAWGRPTDRPAGGRWRARCGTQVAGGGPSPRAPYRGPS